MNYRLDIPQDRDDVVAYLASVSGTLYFPFRSFFQPQKVRP